jgi:hypothetical protein
MERLRVFWRAYFQRLADERGLPYDARSGGTEPDPAINAAVINQLRADGLPVPSQAPRQVDDADLRSAVRIVSLGCDLFGRLPVSAEVLDWSDVPPVSADLPAARRAILAHVEQLIADLEASH